jgi:CRP/FNR family transcriptional regulator
LRPAASNRHRPGCEACETRLNGIFAPLSGEDLARLDRFKTSHTYGRGQALFYEHNPAISVFCIRSGVAKVFKTAPRERHHILYLAGQGDVLGLESLLTGESHSATAEMLEPGTVCQIERTALYDIMTRRPEVCREVARAVARQLLRSEEERTELASSLVRERLALTLLALGSRFGRAVDGLLRIGPDLSREDLADMIGTTPETVIRELARLRERKIITTEGRVICLVSPERLARIARMSLDSAT